MSESGSVTIPLFHCVFNAGGSITHWATSYDRSLYDSLAHLYLVCLADNRTNPRKVVGAFMVKTSRHHDDLQFADAMNLAMANMENLQPFVLDEVSLLPARIGVDGLPPEEMDFLRLAMQQYLKFSSSGSA